MSVSLSAGNRRKTYRRSPLIAKYVITGRMHYAGAHLYGSRCFFLLAWGAHLNWRAVRAAQCFRAPSSDIASFPDLISALCVRRHVSVFSPATILGLPRTVCEKDGGRLASPVTTGWVEWRVRLIPVASG